MNRTKHATHIRLDDDLVERFRRVVETTGADIVLSTYWRHFRDYIAYVLSRYGISEGKFLGSTPGYNRSMKGRSASDANEYSSRGEEIRSWLEKNRLKMRGIVTSSPAQNDSLSLENAGIQFVILDDRPTAADHTEYMQSHFVRTDPMQGLTEEDADRAIRILQGSLY